MNCTVTQTLIQPFSLGARKQTLSYSTWVPGESCGRKGWDSGELCPSRAGLGIGSYFPALLWRDLSGSIITWWVSSSPGRFLRNLAGSEVFRRLLSSPVAGFRVCSDGNEVLAVAGSGHDPNLPMDAASLPRTRGDHAGEQLVPGFANGKSQQGGKVAGVDGHVAARGVRNALT